MKVFHGEETGAGAEVTPGPHRQKRRWETDAPRVAPVSKGCGVHNKKTLEHCRL